MMQKQSRQSAQYIKSKQKLTSQVALTTTVVERIATPNCFSEKFPQTPCEHNSNRLQLQHNLFLKTEFLIRHRESTRNSKPNQRFEIKITRVWNKQGVPNRVIDGKLRSIEIFELNMKRQMETKSEPKTKNKKTNQNRIGITNPKIWGKLQ